jgi:hypothetical protein
MAANAAYLEKKNNLVGKRTPAERKNPVKRKNLVGKKRLAQMESPVHGKNLTRMMNPMIEKQKMTSPRRRKKLSGRS